jgi:hypothetical protein
MSMAELIEKVKEDAKTRTQAQTDEMLRKAYILDEDGYYCKDFFSAETVAKSKKERTPPPTKTTVSK